MTTDYANVMTTECQSGDPEAGKFYVLDVDYRGSGPFHGVVLVNEDALLTDDQSILVPERGQGFPPLAKTPLLEHDPNQGGMPRDLESGISGCWLVSQRLKELFERIDGAGFSFVECNFRLADGTEGPKHYLCAIVRVLDCLDEDRSELSTIVSDEFVNGKFYDVGGGVRLVFDQARVGRAHVFHTPYTSVAFCDQLLKGAIEDAGVTGVRLRDAACY